MQNYVCSYRQWRNNGYRDPQDKFWGPSLIRPPPAEVVDNGGYENAGFCQDIHIFGFPKSSKIEIIVSLWEGVGTLVGSEEPLIIG